MAQILKGDDRLAMKRAIACVIRDADQDTVTFDDVFKPQGLITKTQLFRNSGLKHRRIDIDDWYYMWGELASMRRFGIVCVRGVERNSIYRYDPAMDEEKNMPEVKELTRKMLSDTQYADLVELFLELVNDRVQLTKAGTAELLAEMFNFKGAKRLSGRLMSNVVNSAKAARHGERRVVIAPDEESYIPASLVEAADQAVSGVMKELSEDTKTVPGHKGGDIPVQVMYKGKALPVVSFDPDAGILTLELTDGSKVEIRTGEKQLTFVIPPGWKVVTIASTIVLVLAYLILN